MRQSTKLDVARMDSPHDPRQAWARFELARQALRKATVALARHGVEAVGVKGVVTARWLYTDPSERPLRDVDLRIRPRDFAAAVRAVKAEGWPIDRAVWSYRNIMATVDGLSLDVESYVGPRGVTRLTVDGLLARATKDEDGLWVPEAYDHAVLVTVNVFKDKMRAAADWALEDAFRVVTAPGVDLGRFLARVKEAGVEALAWLVADWMTTERESEGWREVRARLGGDAPARRRYVARVKALWARGETESLALRLLTRASSDHPSRWLPALAASAAWELESRWDLRRRGHR